MRWFKQYVLEVVVVGVFIILVAIIVASYISGDNAFLAGRAVQKTTNTVSEPVEKVTEKTDSFITSLFNFRNIKKENDDLKLEIKEISEMNFCLCLARR